MDKELLVDANIEDGRTLVSRLVAGGVTPAAAFWGRTAEGNRCRLYLAAPPLPPGKVGPVFGIVYVAMSKPPALALGPTDIKVIRNDDPLTQAVLEIQRTRPGRIAAWLRPGRWAGMEVEEVYIYPIPKPKRSADPSFGRMRVRLKRDVEQKFRDDEFSEPLTPREAGVLGQIVASGVAPVQAEYLVRMRREIDRHRPPIPARTEVDAWVTGWWGDAPEDDPNPLLEVEADDGRQGLTFKENTEPV
jgi:hypothetical protein